MKDRVVPIAPLLTLVTFPGLSAVTYGIWTFVDGPYGVHILGAISILSLIFGTYTVVRKINMFPLEVDGDFNVVTTSDGMKYSLDLETDVEELPLKKSITFRVQRDTHK